MEVLIINLSHPYRQKITDTLKVTPP
jgi:hypothetical protein